MNFNCKIFLLLLLLFSTSFAGVTDLWIEKVDPTDTTSIVYLGDTLNLQLRLNTYSEKITGYQFLIQYDAAVFEPVLQNGKPFVAGPFINNPPLSNGFSGSDLFYAQLTPPGNGGNRPYVQGIGIAATFKLRVIGIEVNPPNITVVKTKPSQSGYYLLDAPGTLQSFYNSHSFSIRTDVFSITPAIEDTMFAPGSNLEIPLDEHISGNVNPASIIWQFTHPGPLPAGVTVQIENQNILKVNSMVFSQGMITGQLTASLSGGDQVSQNIRFAVNHAPVFNQPLPVINFDEDTVLRLAKSDLFTDSDNQGNEFNIWTNHPDIFITVTADDSLSINASENWYGNGNLPLYLQDQLQDSLGLFIETIIDFSVLPVNDPPVVSFAIINDTVNVYHDTTVVLNLENFVSDVDDIAFNWEVNNPDPAHLSAQVNGSQLELAPADPTFFGTVNLLLTATDPQNSSASATLVARISHFPPQLSGFPNVFVSQNQPVTLSLNEFVNDPDTPNEDLSWQFSVVNASTNLPDNNIFLNYNSTGQTLEISVTSNSGALDLLRFTVSDPSNNHISGTVKLVVSDQSRPFIYPISEIITFPDTLISPFDLDSLVAHPDYGVDELTWEVKNIDDLQNVSISPSAHFVEIQTNSEFLGVDSITFIATDPVGMKDSIDVSVRCIPRGPQPYIAPLPDFTIYWKTNIPQFYLDLDKYVFDIETPDSLIRWQSSFSITDLIVQISSNHDAKIGSYSNLGSFPVIFTAIDQQDYTTNDTVIVNVIEDAAPQWQTIDDLYISRKTPSTPNFIKRLLQR